MTKAVTFPLLRALMAQYGLTQKDMSIVIRCNQNTFGRKLNCVQEFKLSEMVRIVCYLQEEFGCKFGVEDIFFGWMVTKVTGAADE